ncbi:uncharacterized protein BDR25DRAFT_37562 [Lindgomyces ingoldianus]|uniref:Uncharacterized protein n=1 Tax=Lindgomyces ingoldianus TaxID=673940 RepID=A0ACB6QT21_9PLEO|nr:uncharacterized protein BDR25DRAFT_37562 [Lindgomyces ingoldianus]KAF2470163.1 hypothetical protein BDR25DRAFT_37562 [Lindgomyces ingoldianus]
MFLLPEHEGIKFPKLPMANQNAIDTWTSQPSNPHSSPGNRPQVLLPFPLTIMPNPPVIRNPSTILPPVRT